MGILANFKRKKAIKAYINLLPKSLAKDYGKSKFYTPKQIKKTIKRSGLSGADDCFAIAMFATREAFDLYHQETGEACQYDAMRVEIADQHFDGNADFDASDIATVSSSHGSGFDDCSGADAGGDAD